MATPHYENPAGVSPPLGAYSHVSRAGDLIFVAGQCGFLADNSVAGADVESQTIRAFENVRTVLESQGASPQDVTRFVTYLVSADDIPGFYRAREKYFARAYDELCPPNTLLIVQRLVRPELLVEIDTTAYLPAATRSTKEDA
ncbi:RidA family protein [Amycolatopsis sp. GM8]|uniref:RidA family protein n=1 Tax=Amycolatopsis sp. GM8 TaxID=2896530 RepID=UPI001F31E7C9|nr:RidA family protein [Amycolatopsis sp. GM8]